MSVQRAGQSPSPNSSANMRQYISRDRAFAEACGVRQRPKLRHELGQIAATDPIHFFLLDDCDRPKKPALHHGDEHHVPVEQCVHREELLGAEPRVFSGSDHVIGDQPITKRVRPAGGNVVDLMEALRRSVGSAEPARASKPSKKPRKTASGQKEMLMPIEGKKTANETAAKKPSAKPQRESAYDLRNPQSQRPTGRPLWCAVRTQLGIRGASGECH
jgi:hypothetical protein